jgi:hypothetical protein
MNSIWLSLLWKEWCEFRWKLAALTAILLGVPAVFLLFAFSVAPSISKALEGVIIVPVMTLIPYLMLAGIFVGMSVAGGENSRRTMRFLQALPVPMWQAALVKLVMAILTVSIPILIVMNMVWLIGVFIDPEQHLLAEAARELPPMGQSWGITNWYAARMVASILGVSSLLLWIAACGVNRSDEVRAGAVGFLTIAVIWACWIFAIDRANRFSFHSVESVLETARIALPGGPAVPRFSATNLVGDGLVASISHLAVLMWFLLRFGKVAANQRPGGGLQISDFFRFKSGTLPRRTPVGAVAWKQFREVGPLALVAVVTIITIVLIFSLADRDFRQLDELSNLLGALTISIGVLVALVAGIGVLLEDYSPGVNNFWRSRPINVHLWFVVKYLTGLLVLVISFGSILLLANSLSGWKEGWEAARIIALYFVACYTLALCSYALVRQPIYAVILAMVAPSVAAMVYLFIVYLLGWQQTNSSDFAAILIGLGSAIILAWQAVVRDWGWKQHR